LARNKCYAIMINYLYRVDYIWNNSSESLARCFFVNTF